jgi:hypothetical protein
MAFADPQSITVSGTTSSLPRTGSGVGTGTFQSNDGSLTMDVRHSNGKRIRRTAGVTSKKYAADPLTPSQNVPVQASVRIVVDTPVQGFTNADLEALVVGFLANLSAGTNANLKKLLGAEN